MKREHNRLYVLLIYVVLALTTGGVYLQVHGHEFVSLDDIMYVVKNEQVLRGISRESIVWAFTKPYFGNWHPLTWLSHMLDCELFGLNARGHHLTSLLFHMASTLLLFGVLKRMTGAVWRSAFVAAAFALHPLHVESVAWVSERKDVLSTFFWLLTMWAYVVYVERPSFVRYVPIVVFFALGLMAKQMLVTLPFVLLLLDYWPLGRLRFGQLGGEAGTRGAWKQVFRLVGEKMPLFVLTAISCVMVYVVQQSAGAVASRIGPVVRMANAVISYSRYIVMMLWPAKLAVFYPFPREVDVGVLLGSAVFLMFVSVAVILLVRRRPYLAVGWLWYVGTLLPVIGLVQIGGQAMADRYTYVPLTGLFIMIGWGAADFLKGLRYSKVVLGVVGVTVVLALGVCTWFQVGYWRNSAALFEHALAVTESNYMAHKCLGWSLLDQGKVGEAIDHYQEALRLEPDDDEAIAKLGAALVWKGQVDTAIRHYREFLQRRPGSYQIHRDLGDVLLVREKIRMRSGAWARPTAQIELDEAAEHYREALRLKGDYLEVHYSLATVLERQGKLEAAIEHYKEELRLNPNHDKARQGLKAALVKQDKLGG
jgi:cytochrome c-type biogenesis protein CcmH/NrfG